MNLDIKTGLYLFQSASLMSLCSNGWGAADVCGIPEGSPLSKDFAEPEISTSIGLKALKPCGPTAGMRENAEGVSEYSSLPSEED
jgi:hypothetical protein